MKLPKGWGSGIWGQGDNGDTTFTWGTSHPPVCPHFVGCSKGWDGVLLPPPVPQHELRRPQEHTGEATRVATSLFRAEGVRK